MTSPRHRHWRWIVPAISVAAVAAVGTVPSLVTSASSPPDLPALTPAQLLAKARTAQISQLSGTVELTAHLGLPSLTSVSALGGGTESGTSVASLLAGNHSAKVWIDGADKVRVATVAPLAETNWIRNGNDVWSYDSTTLTATHARITSETASATGDIADSAEESGTADASEPTADASEPDPAHDTPIDFAQHLLDQVTPSTTVSVATPAWVAGRGAYQLVLAPHDPASTVGSVTFSVDAATGLPLDVKVVARSSGSTVLEFGFTDISFDTPAASTFDFTPPPDARVVEAASPTDLLSAGAGRRDHRQRNDESSSDAPAGTATTTGGPAESSDTGHDGPPSDASYTKVGTDWTTAVITSSSSVQRQLEPVLHNAPEVVVGSTRGRLISTALVNVIILDDGRVAVGAVDPQTLESLVAGA